MRKSPLILAIALGLYGSSSLAELPSAPSENSDIPNPPAYEASVTEFDKQQTAGKAAALSGYLYQEAQLKELREQLRLNEKRKIQSDIIDNRAELTPTQIMTLRKRLDDISEAENKPLYDDMSFRVRSVTYDPNSFKPIVVSVLGGFAAQVEFYDSTGAPWPIADDGVVGDEDSFTKKIIGQNSHIASFVMGREYKESNAAVVLKGLPASIPIILKGTRSTVDGRMTVTIPRMGPGAEIQPVFQNSINNVSSELVSLQGGIAPKGAKVLKVTGIPNAEVWYDGTYMYLALPGRLLLPMPINSSVSPTGRFLYKTKPSPYVSVSVDGQRVTGQVAGVYQTEINRAPTVFQKDR